MKASVIILSWNGIEYLENCLDAVLSQDYADLEIIVVDNGSSDGSADFVAEHYPQIQLIRNERNLGFASGNNIGLRAAEGNVLVLLNQDTVPRSNWLSGLMDTLKVPEIGIAGCKLLYPDGTLQHAGGHLYGSRGESGHIGHHAPDNGRLDDPADVEFVTGAALAIARTALEQIGYLDENFTPAYYEDLDWCYRARAAGFRVVYVPQAVVTHYESTSTAPNSYERQFAWHQGRIRFLLKHRSLDWLLDEFGPAESNWIASMDRGRGMMATRRAYLNVLLTLPSIFVFRHSSPKEAKSLARLLTDLRTASVVGITDLQTRPSLLPIQHEAAPLPPKARVSPSQEKAITENQTANQFLAELISKQTVQEQPFASKVPVLGKLIVAARSFWNSVSTKWYARPLIQQQNAFNAQVVHCLWDIHSQLASVREQLANNREQHDQMVNDQERQGALVGWLGRRVDQLEPRSTEHGYLLQSQLRDIAENTREINLLVEHLLSSEKRE